MDTVEQKAPGLKPTQERFLGAILAGTAFTDACREMEMTKANGALLLERLRELGLIVTRPSRMHRRRAIDPGKSGSMIWWDAKQEDQLDPRAPGPARWWVFATPIPRFERADLKPDTWAVVVTAPWGQFAFTASDRERLSYMAVAAEMAHAIPGDDVPADWKGTVRIVTEMVADAMGVEAILPAEFIQQEVQDDGGDDGEDGYQPDE